MQKYKYTCLHVELKSTTLQCDHIQTHTPPACWCLQPHTEPTLQGESPLLVTAMAVAQQDFCSSFGLQKSFKLHPPSPLNSRFQAFKDKEVWKQASLRSTLFQRRGLGIFFKDNTWAQHYRGRPWKEQAVVFPIGGRFVSLRPMLHRIDEGGGTRHRCHSRIQSVAREA